jgi:hypothetical protein
LFSSINSINFKNDCLARKSTIRRLSYSKSISATACFGRRNFYTIDNSRNRSPIGGRRTIKRDGSAVYRGPGWLRLRQHNSGYD